jgi:hypothetical protein
MSSQIKPVLVKDDLLLCESSINFAVQKGGQNVSFQRFPSNAVSSSSHSYTIQTPSTSVIMDREVMWHTIMTVSLSGVPDPGKTLVNYGDSCAFAPFPLHQNVINLQAQINNTSVSNTTQQMLDVLLRNMDDEDLARYNSTTPVQLDNYGSYGDIASLSTRLATETEDVYYTLRPTNSPFSDFRNEVNPKVPPRGSFRIVSIEGNSVQAQGAAVVKNVSITVALTEPLMLSPFVFGDVARKSAGIYGVSQINITAQMDATGKRCFRFIDTITVPNAQKMAITGVSYSTTDSYLECRFITPHPSDLLPEINILPYANFVNYQTIANATIDDGVGATTTSNNIQLNGVPDKLFLFVRNKQSNQTGFDADAYCAITNVSILWNNNSGLLSSATQESLFKMSVEAGCRQSWDAFRGSANAYDFTLTNTGDNNVSTTGSVLVLDFAKHIAIGEDFYAPSSLGAFNLQIQITYTNTTGKTILPEFNILTMSSGIFATQNGQSSVYTNVLNKQQVLDASLQTPMGNSELKRYVGGGLFDSLKSIASSVLPLGKMALSMVPHPLAQGVSGALGALGMGKGGAVSAGAMSAGAETGGARRMKHRLV